MFNGAEILTKFTADTSQVDKATKGFNTSVSNLTKSFLIGELAAKGISKAIGLFNENLDGAIKRTDTLNNFPKVMSNLGISAEDSQQSINTLSEKLTGLPTSLDSAAMAVQRFTSKNGDVNKSTQEFLALNNALLAGGASADIQSTALEQIAQAYAKGKPDMMEWRSMMTAMPAQLKQVANAMGYVDVDTFGEALRDGTVSMDEFMQTIMKLNTQGLDGFQSFEEQARNSTGGIQTSITNMKTAFVRGVADIIAQVDDGLKDLGGLSGVISKIGKLGEGAFKGIGKVLKSIMPMLMQIGKNIFPMIQKLISELAPKLQSIANKILPVVMNTISMLAPLLVNIIESIIPPIVDILDELMPQMLEIGQILMPAIVSIIDSLLPLLPPIINLLKPILSLILAVMKPINQILADLLPPIIKVLSMLIEAVLPAVNYSVEKTANNIQGVVDFIGKFITDRIQIIKNYMNGMITFLEGVFTGDWKKAWNGLKSAVTGIFDGIKTAVSNTFNAIIQGIKDKINGLIGVVNGVIDKINSIEIGGKSPNISKIPKLATGTNYVPQDTLAMIHKGEAIIPKKFNPYANGINASTLAGMGGRNTIIVNVENNMEMDSLGQMVNRIKTYSGGSKNDYNFGLGR